MFFAEGHLNRMDGRCHTGLNTVPAAKKTVSYLTTVSHCHAARVPSSECQRGMAMSDSRDRGRRAGRMLTDGAT